MKNIVGFCITTKNDVTEQIKTKEALIQNKSDQYSTSTFQKPLKKTKNHGKKANLSEKTRNIIASNNSENQR